MKHAINFVGLSYVEIAAKAIELEMIRQSKKAVQEFEAMESDLEQPLITADEARKLGAGKAEWFHPDLGCWCVCQIGDRYLTEINGKNYLYRAIKQPNVLASLPDELIAPEAKKAIGEWLDSQQPKPVEQQYEWVKIEGVDHDPCYEQVVKVEPTCQVSWASVPVGVAVRDKKTNVDWLLQGVGDDEQAVVTAPPNMPFGMRWIDLADLKLAPASEQPWIAVQEFGLETLVIDGFNLAVVRDDHHHIAKFKVTGLAEGWVLK